MTVARKRPPDQPTRSGGLLRDLLVADLGQDGLGFVLGQDRGFNAVRGQGGEVVWLVNGRPSTRRAASAGFDQRFVQPGRYDITVLDDFGHYDRVSLSVR